ncbi:unnamed protein product [Protopolystoma xenopodis]|uniref:histone deacetylase n=1 Tax=Protopolystoma xenopodis TaxID=117903 RepID=A0A3S5A100_9PLAT|nr:unnamed protein product [Protopolystoma xenopodis]
MAELATDDDLLLCHNMELIQTLKESGIANDDERKELSKKFDSVYFSKNTDKVARLAVGAVIEALMTLHRGDVRNAFCLIRPPGHHAMLKEPCGFCIFNNVAIGAKYAIERLHYRRPVLM